MPPLSAGPFDRRLSSAVSTSVNTLVAIPAYSLFVLLARWTPAAWGPGRPPRATGVIAAARASWSAAVAARLVRAYRGSLLHARLNRTGPGCRFIPSCAEYSVRAIRLYGPLRGVRLTIARLHRCHPGYGGDYVDFP